LNVTPLWSVRKISPARNAPFQRKWSRKRKNLNVSHSVFAVGIDVGVADRLSCYYQSSGFVIFGELPFIAHHMGLKPIEKFLSK
jgi:hypothetical protein